MKYIWVNGRLVDWDAATVHVWAEVAIRGVSAFEGILCVWHPDSARHSAVALTRHWRRLEKSASIIDLRMPFSRNDLDQVLAEASDRFAGQDFYARPTAYAVSGRTSLAEDAESGWYVGAFPVDPVATGSTHPVRVEVAWPSRSGSATPPTAKTGGGYLDFRATARLKARLGAEAVVVVDPAGNLVESDDSGLLVVDDRTVLVPHTGGHALNSVTRQILVDLAEARGLRVTSRPVHWSEAHGSVILLGGTLSGVRAGVLAESLARPTSADLGVAAALAEDYHRLLRRADHEVWLEPIEPPCPRAS